MGDATARIVRCGRNRSDRDRRLGGGGQQMLEGDVSAVEVVAGRQAGLELPEPPTAAHRWPVRFLQREDRRGRRWPPASTGPDPLRQVSTAIAMRRALRLRWPISGDSGPQVIPGRDQALTRYGDSLRQPDPNRQRQYRAGRAGEWSTCPVPSAGSSSGCWAASGRHRRTERSRPDVEFSHVCGHSLRWCNVRTSAPEWLS